MHVIWNLLIAATPFVTGVMIGFLLIPVQTV